jgi:hypothetical protein
MDDLDAMLAVVAQLPAVLRAMIDKLVLDAQTVAIAEAEGDLEGAWAIAAPWLRALNSLALPPPPDQRLS